MEIRNPITHLKFVYENAEWQQVNNNATTYLDDPEKIMRICDAEVGLVNEKLCLYENLNWSAMEGNWLTQDIYQFIAHRAQVVRNGFDKEVEAFGIDQEKWAQTKDFFIEGLDYALTMIGI